MVMIYFNVYSAHFVDHLNIVAFQQVVVQAIYEYNVDARHVLRCLFEFAHSSQ